MLVLKLQLKEARIPQAVVARAVAVSEALLAQIVNHDAWPRTSPEEVRQRLASYLESQGIDTAKSFDAVQDEVTPHPVANATEDENMLLTKQILQPDTRKWFGLFRNPFSDTAVQSTDDVFSSRDIRYVRETMFQTATYGGMLAVYGESGSGKSTLRRDLIERLHHEAPGTLVIEPYVLAMEDNDHAGKTLKSASIAEAILRTIAPKERARLSPDARFAQIHQALRGSAESGGSHVLIIEEAHSLPVPTLKHLKRFLELDFGHKRLLSIILVGQQELREKLSERNPSVREVVQRCELVQLPPLDNDLEAFLAFKFSRAGKPAGEVIDESGIQAIRGRLTYRYGTKDSISLLYPLAVGNLVTAAMNEAAGLGVPVINADIVNSVGKQQ